MPKLDLIKIFWHVYRPLNIFLTRFRTSEDIRDLISVFSFIGSGTPVQPVTPVGGTVQIKQLIVVQDRVLCTRYFVLWKYRTQFVYDYTHTVHQLTGLTDGSKYGSTESTILWAVSLLFTFFCELSRQCRFSEQKVIRTRHFKLYIFKNKYYFWNNK